MKSLGLFPDIVKLIPPAVQLFFFYVKNSCVLIDTTNNLSAFFAYLQLLQLSLAINPSKQFCILLWLRVQLP